MTEQTDIVTEQKAEPQSGPESGPQTEPQAGPQAEQKQEKKYILITGGAGFIGSYICKILVGKGYTPLIVDMFAQYANPLSQKNSKTWHTRFSGILDSIVVKRANCANYAVMYDLLEEYQPSHILHLAALPLAKMNDSSPEDFKEGTVDATATLLHAAYRLKQKGKAFLKKFVYVSSSMVYGNFLEDPVKETHRTSPVNVYGTMKLAGENTTQGLCNTYGVSYAIIRPSAVYGPTDINRRVSQIFVENAMHGKKLTIMGGKDERLDFSYVSDVAIGMVLATLTESPDAQNQIFNITGGNARSLLDFAEIVKQYFPDVILEIVEREKGRPKRGGLDITKAKTLLGYAPVYGLEKGIKTYLDFLLKKEGDQENKQIDQDMQSNSGSSGDSGNSEVVTHANPPL